MSMPNSRTRYSAKLRSSSGVTVSTKAASTTPSVEPIPPSTTMARINADSKK
ncbi:glucosamine-1-phosphate N-acetyltransferase, partial [Corchorus olitorius]